VTAAATATPFVLALVEGGPAAKAKRQDTTVYLQTDGSTTTDCNGADAFTVTEGKLFGEGKLYAAPPGANSAVFSTGNKGNITTTFTLSPELGWSNTAFPNVDVIFAEVAGFVTAFFSGAAPAGSTSLVLKSVPVTGKS
jgi:hypothetical protein